MLFRSLAGNGNFGFSGDGGPAAGAQLRNPFGVAVDNTGNLYIADTLNDRIRKVSLWVGRLLMSDSQAPPGGTARLPVTLALANAVKLDSLSFGLALAANDAGPNLPGTLSFVKDPGISTPLLVDSGTGSNVISVFWSGLTTPLSGTVKLGDILVSIPTSTGEGRTYRIQRIGAGASLESQAVTLDPGPNATLAVTSDRKSVV